jgi:bacteriocin biosynthesis cyclodehydratase domain-containing protein
MTWSVEVDVSDNGARRPVLKPWYRIAHDEKRTLLEYGGRLIVFEGEATGALLAPLLPLLDGTRTLDEILEIIGEPARPAVEHALAVLDEHQLLTEGLDQPDALHRLTLESVSFLAAVDGVAPEDAWQRLQEATVAIAGGGDGAAELARLLWLSGVGSVDRLRLQDRLPAAELLVASPARGELPRLEAWNRRAVEHERLWLQMLPFDGRFAALGPLYVPGETACYDCYRYRRLSHSGYDEAEFLLLDRQPGRWPSPPVLTAVTAGIAAGLILSWLVGCNPFLPGVMFALEWGAAPALTKHAVYRVPRCPVCSGISDLAPPSPWHEEALHAGR